MEEKLADRIAALEAQVMWLVVALVVTAFAGLGGAGVAILLSLETEAVEAPDFAAEFAAEGGVVAAGGGGGVGGAADEAADVDDVAGQARLPGTLLEGEEGRVLEIRELRIVGRPGGEPLVRIGADPSWKPRGGGFVEFQTNLGMTVARLGAGDHGQGSLELRQVSGTPMLELGAGESGRTGGAMVYSPDSKPFAWVGFDEEGWFGIFETEEAERAALAKRRSAADDEGIGF